MPRINILVLPIVLSLLHPAFAARITLPTPTGGGSFGSSVTVLPNRNFVVTDPGFSDPVTGVANVGAAHLLSPTGALISTLRGATLNDTVGRGIIVLSNGPLFGNNSVNGSLFNAVGVPFTHDFVYNPSPIPQDRTLIVAPPLENRVVPLN